MLYDYQINHVEQIKNLLTSDPRIYNSIPIKNCNIVSDMSDVGTGKTHTSCAVAKMMNLDLFVLCNKSTIKKWYNTAQLYGTNVITVTNYERIRGNSLSEEIKWFDMRYGYTDVPSFCPYITKYLDEDNQIRYKWDLKNCLIVFDESHKGKNKSTYNSSLIMGAKELSDNNDNNVKVLLLSATPVESETDIKYLLFILGYMSTCSNDTRMRKEFSFLCKSLKLTKKNKIKMSRLHNLFIESPLRRCVYMRRELEGEVKSIQIDMKDEAVTQIEYYNSSIQKNIDVMKGKFGVGDILGKITKARKSIESIKVPYIVELAINAFNEGNSVIIFTNFIHPAENIANEIATRLDQDVGLLTSECEDKEEIVEQFQRDEIRFLVCTAGSGSESLDFQDMKGKYPRFSLILLPVSGIQLRQSVGRVDRVGQKSKPKQIVVFGKGPIEYMLAKTMETKLKDVSKLQKTKCLFDFHDKIK